jgi:fructose 1,6-bisphosphate aldolase/phosphatase
VKVTLSVIKADVGSIGGHTKPSERMLGCVRARLREVMDRRLVLDGLVTYTGDDIAIIMSHTRGVGAVDVHQFAWQSFLAATDEARTAGLYGAGQDLLVDAPSGNVRGAGPAVAEIEFDRDPSSKERPAEAFLVFAADKCGPGAYNYPLYAVFCDPMHNGGLLLSPKLHKGFTLTIIDMDHKSDGGDRVIRLDVPERLWDVACLLQNPDRFAIEAIHSRHKPDEQIASVSATRLHNIAGKYTGKDDPVMLGRVQMNFPATGEVLAPYSVGHFAGCMRGSHQMPLMPVSLNCGTSYFDGPPMVSCAAFAEHNGKLTEPYDAFAHPFWNSVRDRVANKAIDIRRQGFFGAAMLPMSELEYTGIMEKLKVLDRHFEVRSTELVEA